MLTEINGKAGQVCQAAKEGRLRCPLIVRPTSEDVVTGEIFQVLRCINPRWWLPDLLNTALTAMRFQQQVYRQLKIELWENQPAYPRELLPWDEGSTQVDVVLRWENPRTTVFVEMKYSSELSLQSANGADQAFPTDQLVRNIRVGLWRSGWFRQAGLFADEPRDFVQILMAPERGNRLVLSYRQPKLLRAAIPESEQLRGLPRAPFIGELGYLDLVGVLQQNRRWLTRPERLLADDLIEYLRFKLATLPRSTPSYRQVELPSREK